MQSDSARAAYILLDDCICWLSVPTNRIPYILGDGDERRIDVETNTPRRQAKTVDGKCNHLRDGSKPCFGNGAFNPRTSYAHLRQSCK